MNKTITIIDSTLRDGSHALGHQIGVEDIAQYAKEADRAGLPVLMVGHGNGLGASSLQLGFSKHTDLEMIATARKELSVTKLGAFLIPGFGTIQKDIAPALSAGVDIMMIASHCTEATVTRQHIEYTVSKGVTTYGVLMMSHMVDAKELLVQAKHMQNYGASGVLLMDSAGAYLPKDVKHKISTLVDGLSIPIGFHAHNNLGLAVANSLVAVESGAMIIDATMRSLGAGAGNCQLEVIVAVLSQMGYNTGLDLYKLIDISELIVKPMMKKPIEISSVTLVSGLAGVFSGFAPHAEKAAREFEVDVRDILMELGRRKVVGGQEDSIVDVAHILKQKKDTQQQNFQLESLT